MRIISGIITALFIALSLGSCDKSVRRVVANLENLPDGRVYLCDYHDPQRLLDSTYSIGGIFIMPLKNAGEGLAAVKFDTKPEVLIPFISDRSDLYINGDLDDPLALGISGSDANEQFALYRTTVEREHLLLRTIQTGLEHVSRTGSDSLELERLVIKRDSIMTLINDIRLTFIEQNKENLLSQVLAVTDSEESAEQVSKAPDPGPDGTEGYAAVVE